MSIFRRHRNLRWRSREPLQRARHAKTLCADVSACFGLQRGGRLLPWQANGNFSPARRFRSDFRPHHARNPASGKPLRMGEPIGARRRLRRMLRWKLRSSTFGATPGEAKVTMIPDAEGARGADCFGRASWSSSPRGFLRLLPGRHTALGKKAKPTSAAKPSWSPRRHPAPAGSTPTTILERIPDHDLVALDRTDEAPLMVAKATRLQELSRLGEVEDVAVHGQRRCGKSNKQAAPIGEACTRVVACVLDAVETLLPSESRFRCSATATW